MKTMRILFAVVLGLALSGTFTFAEAQGRRGGGGRGGFGQLDAVGLTITAALEHKEELELTEEQVVALEALQKKTEEAMEPITKEVDEIRQQAQSGGGGGLRERIQPLMEKAQEIQGPLQEELAGILSEAQLEQARTHLPRRGRRGG